MPNHRPKVVLAMSGGVDSSVAAALLLRQGFEVLGAFMRLGSAAAPDGSVCGAAPTCCSAADAEDARKVAAVLGIPLYIVNFQDDFGQVIDYFVAEYNRGRTPNPCVRCNDWLKFGKLARYAEAVGADYIATGHYARIGTDSASGRRALWRGKDHRKDQSYVLFGLKAAMLDRMHLPIGEYEKNEVRAMAAELGLAVHDKPDSQEICFVPDQDYAALVAQRTPGALKPGEIVDAGGRTVGIHGGHQHFTIGQRRGLGVAMGKPVYVIDIDARANRVTIGDRDLLLKSRLVAKQLNWLTGRFGQSGDTIQCTAKIRYNHQPQPATASIAGDELTVRFDEPQPAITPGQAVVLYDGDAVLGGGWIDLAA